MAWGNGPPRGRCRLRASQGLQRCRLQYRKGPVQTSERRFILAGQTVGAVAPRRAVIEGHEHRRRIARPTFFHSAGAVGCLHRIAALKTLKSIASRTRTPCVRAFFFFKVLRVPLPPICGRGISRFGAANTFMLRISAPTALRLCRKGCVFFWNAGRPVPGMIRAGRR